MDAIFALLLKVYEIGYILIKDVYDFGLAIANDPVVIYVTRALIAEPIIAVASFIGTVYLGAYAFITNKAIKYYLFMTYLMPVIQYFLNLYRSFQALAYLVFTNPIQFVIRTVIFSLV